MNNWDNCSTKLYGLRNRYNLRLIHAGWSKLREFLRQDWFHVRYM